MGRPPDSVLEHVTLASIGSFLVIFAFTITTSIALSRIRSKAKKGATMSALCVTAISSANHLDKLLFFSFVRAALNWIFGDGNMMQMLVVLLATALIQVLCVVLRSKLFAMIRIILIKNVFSLPMLLLSWIRHPPRAACQARHIRRRSSGGRKFHRSAGAFCTVFNVDKRVPSTELLDFDDTAVPTVIADNSANICICNDNNMYETFDQPVHLR